MSKEECCPKFDPAPWDEKEIEWVDKCFIKDRITSIFHIPINFGRVVGRNMKLIESSGASNPDYMMLSDENSLWGSDLYIAVDREITGARIERISGRFITKVHEGAYSKVGQWIEDMKAYARKKGKDIERFYVWYTTCPICAKKYGRNYIVIFAKIMD